MARPQLGHLGFCGTRLLQKLTCDTSGIKIKDRQLFLMPFRNVIGFNLDTMNVMRAAYDAAVAKLQLKPDDPRTGKLALPIVQLVKSGVVDPDSLADKARRQIE
jgi:hypothetical protein